MPNFFLCFNFLFDGRTGDFSTVCKGYGPPPAAQTIFSSRYSQASQEDLCIPALSVHTAQVSHVISHEASHMPSVNPGNASTAATRGEHPVCPQAYALPSIHSFHTQLEVASEWHGTRTDDTHSMANASVYESCISASHAHSICATTAQTYAASSTLAETTQGKQDNTGEAAVPPSSSIASSTSSNWCTCSASCRR